MQKHPQLNYCNKSRPRITIHNNLQSTSCQSYGLKIPQTPQIFYPQHERTKLNLKTNHLKQLLKIGTMHTNEIT